jgi:two-component system cell cycle response regulator
MAIAITIVAILVALPAAALGGRRLLAVRREARRCALEDRLTGLMNGRAFAKRVGDGLNGAPERTGEMVLLMYDIDGLAAINGRFGREFGDFVLRLFAEKARAEIRDDDLLFRLGEDEFCSILPATSQEAAAAIAGRIRAAFSEKPLRARKKENVRPTASVGMATSTTVGFSIDRLKAAAEAALADAKRAGGDRLVAYCEMAGVPSAAAA